MTELREVFNDDIITEFKNEIKKVKKSKKLTVFTPNVINAYFDILECIEQESLKTGDDLDDYIDLHYSKNENEYLIIISILAFFDGDYTKVSEIFAHGTFDINRDEMDLGDDDDTCYNHDDY